MTHQVRIAGQDIAFACADGESLLDAAERAGWALPYSCRKGVCSSCEGGLVAGEATQRGGRIAGPRSGVLFCQARPCTDLEIAPKRIERRDPPARRRVDAFVFRLAHPTPDVTVLHLRYPPQHRVRFQAGQYLQVLLDDGTRRNYSMAAGPQQTDGTTLHIRRIPGGRFSDTTLGALLPGSLVPIELPFGDFFWRDDEVRPPILLASGTGMAPLAAMLDDLARRQWTGPLPLYWGVRRAADLYLGPAITRWQALLPGLRYTPVLSEPEPGWTGRIGLVHHAVLDDHQTLAGHVVYASGNPAMIAAARAGFTARGLAEDAFRADPFVESGG